MSDCIGMETRRDRRRRLTLATLLLATVAVPAWAAPGGFWDGAIEVPGRTLPLMIEIQSQGDGWVAQLFIPEQGVRDVTMTGLSIDGKAFAASIPGMPGEPRFVGSFAEDGSSLSGTYTQAGRDFPFRFIPAEKPDALEQDIYGAYRSPARPGEGAVGTWRSVFEVGPHRYRMELVVEQTGETLQATLLNHDRGPKTPQPMESIEQSGRAVAIELGGGATFSGDLNEDGSRLTGTFSQGGQQFPLEFWRAG